MLRERQKNGRIRELHGKVKTLTGENRRARTAVNDKNESGKKTEDVERTI